MSEARDLYLQRSEYLNGPDIASSWTPEEREAWAGYFAFTSRLLRVHTREFEDAHEMSLSMIGLLGRLEAAEDHAIRLSDLAAAMDLSLGRVSRIVDIAQLPRPILSRRAVRAEHSPVVLSMQLGSEDTRRRSRLTSAPGTSGKGARLRSGSGSMPRHPGTGCVLAGGSL